LVIFTWISILTIFCNFAEKRNRRLKIGQDAVKGPLNRFQPGDNRHLVGKMSNWPRPFVLGSKVRSWARKVVDNIPTYQNVLDGHIYIRVKSFLIRDKSFLIHVSLIAPLSLNDRLLEICRKIENFERGCESFFSESKAAAGC
jgi:hypothetical protein